MTNTEDEIINNPTTSFKSNALGLTADEFGNLYLAGNPFCGYGFNSFSAVTRYVYDGCAPTFEEQFKLAKKYNIPFIRVNFGGYWSNYYKSFDDNPDEVLQKMQEILECAQKYEIGLVCSILWYDGAVSAHVGEKRSAMGNPESKTVAYTKKYVSTIVNKFKDMPAVWAWEIGNEYNLDADLCDRELKNYLPAGPDTPKTPDGYDYYTSEELATYVKIVGEEIRKYDKDRIISTGNGDMRSSSKAMHNAALNHDENHLWDIDWSSDTIDDFYDMCAYYTPDPLDTVCFHIQHSELDENGNASYIDLWPRFGQLISTADYITAFLTAAKKIGKVMYFGEMGDLIWKETAADAAEYFDNLVRTCVNAGVVFASTWQFMTNKLIATDKGIDGDKLRSLRTANIEFITAGKQKLSAYWSKYN